MISLLAHQHSVVINIMTLKRWCWSWNCSEGKTTKPWKSWRDLYKMKWLTMGRCKDTDGNTLVQKRGCVLNHKLIYTRHFIEGVGAVKVVWLEATTQNSISSLTFFLNVMIWFWCVFGIFYLVGTPNCIQVSTVLFEVKLKYFSSLFCPWCAIYHWQQDSPRAWHHHYYAWQLVQLLYSC